MKNFLPLAALLLSATASAQQAAPAPKKPEPAFQICLFPNPCGARRGAPPKPEAPKVETVPAVPADPLTRAIVNGNAERGDDGIVSSIRLSPSHTGTGSEQIVTRGTGLRDALAPASGAGLPGSVLPANKNAAKGAAEDEWTAVDSKTASAGQLNEMRSERKAAKSAGEAGSTAAGRMFKTHK
jgi:hypothetical protein